MNSAVKIDSPLAKVLASGQVTCLLCNSNVKSAKVWTAHVNGRQHRENVLKLKKSKERNSPRSTEISATRGTQNGLNGEPAHCHRLNAEKRKVNEEYLEKKPVAEKKVKLESENSSRLPADFFDVSNVNEPSTSAGPRPVKGERSEPKRSSAEGTTVEGNLSGSVPFRFKSSTSEPDGSVDDEELTPWEKETLQKKTAREPVVPKENTAEALPEGFFDDPNVDKKVRKADPKDPLDEEWAKFQKEMQSAAISSEAMEDEYDEQTQLEREMDEVEKQMSQWEKINQLQQHKDDVLHKLATHSAETGASSMGEDSSEDAAEEDFDSLDVEELNDWRRRRL